MEQDEERVVVDSCSNCMFYKAGEYEVEDIEYEPTYGLCRRFPPRRIDGSVSGFPAVEDDEWCGEHQKKICLI